MVFGLGIRDLGLGTGKFKFTRGIVGGKLKFTRGEWGGVNLSLPTRMEGGKLKFTDEDGGW